MCNTFIATLLIVRIQLSRTKVRENGLEFRAATFNSIAQNDVKIKFLRKIIWHKHGIFYQSCILLSKTLQVIQKAVTLCFMHRIVAADAVSSSFCLKTLTMVTFFGTITIRPYQRKGDSNERKNFTLIFVLVLDFYHAFAHAWCM